MIHLILKYFLFFLAGIVIHMGFMHHFSFDRARTHPMIRIMCGLLNHGEPVFLEEKKSTLVVKKEHKYVR